MVLIPQAWLTGPGYTNLTVRHLPNTRLLLKNFKYKIINNTLEKSLTVKFIHVCSHNVQLQKISILPPQKGLELLHGIFSNARKIKGMYKA